MESVLLIAHLFIALFLIAVVLLQRSEGGALGIGGGGGGLVSARGAATALSKVTWGLAIAFICTSLLLTIVAGGRTVSPLAAPSADDPNAIELPVLPGTSDDGDIPLPAAPGND